MSIRVLVADDHEVVRSGLSSLLDDSTIEIVGEAADGNQAVALAQELKPDVVLLDIRMSEGDGLTALEMMHEQMPEVKVVMLSTYDNPTYIARAVAMGASDYVLKGSDREHLITAIRKVHAGEMWVDRVVATTLIADLQRPGRKVDADRARIATLTARERDVVNLVGEGLANKAIAERLSISDNTVRHHLTSIFAKLGVTDRLSLVVYAYRHKII